MIASIVLAAVWAAVNLWVLARCLNGMLGIQRYTRWQWAGLLGLKLLVLYGSAWWLLQWPGASPLGCAVGVTIVLACGVALAVRQAMRLASQEQVAG